MYCARNNNKQVSFEVMAINYQQQTLKHNEVPTFGVEFNFLYPFTTLLFTLSKKIFSLDSLHVMLASSESSALYLSLTFTRERR